MTPVMVGRSKDCLPHTSHTKKGLVERPEKYLLFASEEAKYEAFADYGMGGSFIALSGHYVKAADVGSDRSGPGGCGDPRAVRRHRQHLRPRPGIPLASRLSSGWASRRMACRPRSTWAAAMKIRCGMAGPTSRSAGGLATSLATFRVLRVPQLRSGPGVGADIFTASGRWLRSRAAVWGGSWRATGSTFASRARRPGTKLSPATVGRLLHRILRPARLREAHSDLVRRLPEGEARAGRPGQHEPAHRRVQLQ